METVWLIRNGDGDLFSVKTEDNELESAIKHYRDQILCTPSVLLANIDVDVCRVDTSRVNVVRKLEIDS